ncbi:Peptidoglycan-associated lipoprotein [Porphyromonas levii]|uniref:OmpA family protein n=1 Tax=Porphyromonas levii TaxID=28114 RepID=UPI000373F63F|nr:OmpA family protein [Porphyromonas levii]MBR8713038.1 Peptidoglycan-associated lipoprotein [Porphyromonas levii]MBR8715085.1 Peptidoglycan-associated lipoprotein [Porphyromonas levii]MBR8727551.1 Peptidoglycan-associated lipoprotein [Porphyromonas levii]MBR8735946.1 Peptidoglycan-associated lipoprotein [Porphyromonas levii]MBR8770157.1 Peptidoglycan-associated lipoprotein [Porphyromonas levii]
MRSPLIIISAIAAALLGLGNAQAQEVVTTDSLVVVQGSNNQLEQDVWKAIRSAEGYDELSDDALLPISREQAEELIAKLIVEARQPYVEAAHRDSALLRFKVETLKRRALDQALARTYTEPYEQRLAQMERLLYAILLSKGDIDPAIINQLLPGAPGQQVPYVVAQNSPSAGTTTVPATTLTPATKNGKSSTPVTPDKAIALRPGLDLKELDLYMSVAYFGFDSSAINSETEQTLDNVVKWMEENDLRISLRGYASPEGRMSYNNKLSARRVNAVADYLMKKGIPSTRLEVIPSGIDSMKDTKSKYPQGRRVEIRPILY